MTVTYASYLKTDELLELQTPLSDGPEHDETLFIIIHQVYELWFKQILHELRLLQRCLESGDGPTAYKALKRTLTILKTLVSQVDILETMTPVSFNSFRARLDTASGFQSAQFREVEATLGHRSPAIFERIPRDNPGRERVAAIYKRRSVYDSFLLYLRGRGHDIPEELLERNLSEWNPSSEEVRRLLVRIYHNHPAEAQICELLVDLDEGLQEWRYRHVKMVERTIGAKPGTGGSPGVEYLKRTLFQPLFPDLWAIRAEL